MSENEIQKPMEFPNLFRREVTIEEFSKQLYEAIVKHFDGLVSPDRNFGIRIQLITGEHFEVKVSK